MTPTPEPLRALDDFVHETVLNIGRERAARIEERIRLLLNPKPRWWPEWFWRAMLRRVLTIETSTGLLAGGQE